jgi:hypothetical protein
MKTDISKITLSLATLLSLSVTTIYAENLIQNGSFENFKVESNNNKWKRVTLDRWNSTAKLLTNKAGRAKATDGRFKLALDSSDSLDSISQMVSLTPNKKYQLSFDAYAFDTKSADIAIWINNKKIDVITPTKTWEKYSVTFIAKSSNVTLKLSEVIGQQKNRRGAIVDNVILKSVSSQTTTTTNTTDTNTTTPTVDVDRVLDVEQGELLSYTLDNYDKKTKLVNAPDGMTLNSRTGEIRWQPIQVQEAIFKVQNGSEITTMKVIVEPNSNFALPNKNAIFVAPHGKNTNSGSYNSPLADLGAYCGKDGLNLAGKTVYYRGGVYKNYDFGTDISVSHKSLAPITCYGQKDNPLTIKPWRDEQVKFKFDSAYGVQLAGDYLRFDGFEVEGISQDIDYKKATDAWWEGSSYFNGQGINIRGVDVVVQNNIIHDIPGAGINTRGNAIVDRLKIDNNIIFNTSWWSISGTTALGIVGANKGKNVSKFDSGVGIEITNNLIFSSESRIFSHVFSKGFSTLIIDEGSSMLLKQDKGPKIGTYNKGFLIKNNFFLFNGKGASLRWDNIKMINNTFYNNGTTMKGSGGGIRSQEGTNMIIESNAVYMDIKSNLNAIDFHKTAVSVKSCKNNRYWTLAGNKSLKNPQKCALDTNDNSLLKDMFASASENNFELVTNENIGALQTVMDAHIDTMEELGYKIASANYKRKINGVAYPVDSPEYYQSQIDKIIKLAKDDYNATVTYSAKKHEYKVTFPNAKKRPEGIDVSNYILKVEDF